MHDTTRYVGNRAGTGNGLSEAVCWSPSSRFTRVRQRRLSPVGGGGLVPGSWWHDPICRACFWFAV